MENLKAGFQRGMGFFLALFSGAAMSLLFAQNFQFFSPGQVLSSAQVNANLAEVQARFARTAPVGAIIAFHANFPGTPTLPDGWMACDGRLITDPDSPYAGANLPNLNSPPNSWNAKGVFLRGHNVSGMLENDQLQSHNHNDAGHTHPAYGHRISGVMGFGEVTTQIYDRVTTAYYNPGILPGTASLGDPEDSGSGAGSPRHGNETRPASFSVVWIMRIK